MKKYMKFIASILVAFIVSVSLCGLVTRMDHMGHHAHPDCPFITVNSVCVSPIAHIEQWSYLSIFAAFLVAISFFPLVFRIDTLALISLHRLRRKEEDLRPLYESLFSDGILHSKAY